MYAYAIVWTRSMPFESTINSLYFVVNRFFMKLLNTNDINTVITVKHCQRDILAIRCERFELARYRLCM